MKRMMTVGMMAVVVGISGMVWGESTKVMTTAPASGPGTQGAVEVVALTGPKKVLAEMMVAINAGDEAGVRKTLIINKNQEEAVNALLKLTAATSKLQATADKIFGEEGAKAFGSVTPEQTEARMKAIRDADMRIDGGTAIVTIAEDSSLKHAGGTLKLTNIEGQWKIDAGSLFRLDSYKTESDLKDRITLAGKLTTLTGTVTQEVASGKFPTAGEAYQAFMARSLAIVKEGQGAGTQPK